MTAPLWLAILSGIAGLLVSLTVLARILVVHGADRQRLDALAEWQRCKSIDRFEFDDHGKRITNLEGEMTDVCKGVADLRVQVAAIPEQLRSQEKVSTLQYENLSHGIKNLRMAVEAVAQRRPLPAES